MRLRAAASGPGRIGVDHFGKWSVWWKQDEFFVPEVGSFPYAKVVLPVGLRITHEFHAIGFAVVSLDTHFRFELLHDSPLDELERFKRQLSRWVLAEFRVKPYFCSDCGREAGMLPMSGRSTFCRGCRRPYCKNPDCLHRLRVDSSPDGTLSCRACGAAVGTVAS